MTLYLLDPSPPGYDPDRTAKVKNAIIDRSEEKRKYINVLFSQMPFTYHATVHSLLSKT